MATTFFLLYRQRMGPGCSGTLFLPTLYVTICLASLICAAAMSEGVGTTNQTGRARVAALSEELRTVKQSECWLIGPIHLGDREIQGCSSVSEISPIGHTWLYGGSFDVNSGHGGLNSLKNWKRVSDDDPLNSVQPPATSAAPAIVSTDAEENTAVQVSDCGVGAMFTCRGRCGQFRDAPCSCHAQCLVYRTCCEDFDQHCPETGRELSAAQRRFLDAEIQCPETLRWPVVASCLDNVDPSAIQKCERSAPVEKSDLIPVTDTVTGIHFKNVHCAKCNGITLSSLMPWSGDFLCMMANVYIDQYFESALSSREEKCKTLWQSPGRHHSHGRCLPDSQLTAALKSCQKDTAHDCLTQPSSYVSVYKDTGLALYKNRHCLSCDANQTFLRSCHPVQKEDLVWAPPYFYSMQALWNEANGTWTFRGRVRPEPHKSAVYEDIISCNTTEDLAPSHCQVLRCHPYYVLKDNRCLLSNKNPMTIFITGQISPAHSHSNGTELLQQLLQSVYFQPYDKDHKLVSVMARQLDQDDPYWTLCLWMFLQTEDGYTIVSVYEQFKLTAFSVLENYGINFTRLCFTLNSDHILFEDICYDYVSYVLVQSGKGQDVRKVKSMTTDRTSLGDIEVTRAWPWQTYVSLACLLLSILSLAVCLFTQHLLSIFQSSTHARSILFLCLSLLMNHVFCLLAIFPSTGSLPCSLIAGATHWALLPAPIWINVNLFHLWTIVRPDKRSQLPISKALHYGWHLYAWLSPFSLLAPGVALDQLAPDNEFAPLYGQDHCLFNSKPALLVFFVVPSLFVGLVNVLFIILVTHALRSRKSQFGNAISSVTTEVKTSSKLAVLIVVTCLLGLPITVHPEPILDDVFTIANASLGFLATLAIMGNKMFIKLLVSIRHRGRRYLMHGFVIVTDRWGQYRRQRKARSTVADEVKGNDVRDDVTSHISPPLDHSISSTTTTSHLEKSSSIL